MSRCSILALQLLFLAAAASTATARFRSAVEQQVPEQQLAAAAVVSDETAGLRQLRQSPRTFDVSNLPTRTATTAAGELPAWDSPPEATASKGSPFDTTKSSTSSSGSSNSGNAGTKLQPTAGPAQSAPPVTRPTLAPAPAVKEAPKAAPTPPPPTPKPEPAVAKEPPPPSKPAITPAFQPSQSISVNGGSSSSTAAGTDKGSRSSSGGGGGSGSALAPAPVPVTAVAPTPEPVRLPPTCPSGRSLKVHAASSSRMCVLQKATATEGLVWNAIGQQVRVWTSNPNCAHLLNPSTTRGGGRGGHPVACVCVVCSGQLQPERAMWPHVASVVPCV